jgi:hypothetical protein
MYIYLKSSNTMVATEKNILDVFTTVTSNLDTKIDTLHQKEISKLTEIEANISKIQKDITSKDAYNKTLPKAVGIDLTLDTTALNKEIAEQRRLIKLRENYFSFVKEKEALKLAFAPINALVLNKQVFHDLTDYFGLVRLYKTDEKDDLYCVVGNHQTNFDSHKVLLEQKSKIFNDKNVKYKEEHSRITNINEQEEQRIIKEKSASKTKAYFATGGFLLITYLIVTGGDFQNFLIEKVGLTNLEITIYTILFTLSLSFVAYKLFLLFFDKKEVAKKLPFPEPPSKEFVKPYIQQLFPNNEVRSIKAEGYGTWTYFKLTLPKPPEHTRQKIVNALNIYEQIKLKGELCTVADTGAIKLEIEKIYHLAKPIPLPPPRPISNFVYDDDPGVVIEYGHFAVILPETFYNITNLESNFLNEAIKIAEKWDARKYLLN